MTVKLLNEHHLEFLSLKGGCTGSSESTLAKMPHCWKSHVAAHLYYGFYQAFMSMFQILTQEGWVGPLDGVLEKIGDNSALRILVGLYFILFHLFVSVVSKRFPVMQYE